KVMAKTNKDFALCLSTGIAKPLVTPSLHEIFAQVLTPLLERANRAVHVQLLAHKRKAEQLVAALIVQQQAAAKVAEEVRLAEQAKLQEQLEARREAARKALAEAKALANEKKRCVAEQAAEIERLRIEQAAADAAEQLERRQQATNRLNELQVGAWLEINAQGKGEKLRAKLSVIISSTGKYIFADQVGRKLAEYSRTELIELIANNTVKVLRNGDNFEDQLAKVIRGLRRDIP